MKEIKLTKGEVALVDDEDFDYLNQFNWYAVKSGYTYYARRSAVINGKYVKIYMHRDVLNLKIGEKICVDHIDHNGLNNQRSNIRLATRSQNNMNKNLRVGASGYRGVNWAKHAQRWAVRIFKNRKQIFIGYFETLELAAQAYNEAAAKHHGEFATLNKLAA